MRTLLILSAFLLNSMPVMAQHHHGGSASLKAEKVPEHSLYHLKAEWTTHRNESVTLRQFKGQPVIVVMFYGNCTQVCPILIRDTWRLYNSVDESMRGSVNVLAVSFDRENDSPEVLRKYAEYEQLNIDGWHFVTAKETDIRSLAMMLGVQYVKQGNGEFAHSNLVSVLDAEGKVAVRVEGLNQPMASAALKIENMLKQHTMQ
ncbi:SCO family protein [Gracilimonas sp. BCB1]|uniref:SCO family protein n=1 Tax=Gracilimonas sp. BCB1 TaxID=3152362 RepID=UPI0032D9ABF1